MAPDASSGPASTAASTRSCAGSRSDGSRRTGTWGRHSAAAASPARSGSRSQRCPREVTCHGGVSCRRAASSRGAARLPGRRRRPHFGARGCRSGVVGSSTSIATDGLRPASLQSRAATDTGRNTVGRTSLRRAHGRGSRIVRRARSRLRFRLPGRLVALRNARRSAARHSDFLVGRVAAHGSGRAVRQEGREWGRSRACREDWPATVAA